MKNITRTVSKAAQEGFSLVELMVVVTIIGILAGVAVPKFQTFKARANQTEAKSGLSGLYLAVQAFEANYNEMPAVAAAGDPATVPAQGGAKIGFTLTGAKQKYTYQFLSSVAPGTSGWAATASSISPMKSAAGAFTDSLRINTNKWMCSPYDAVTGTAAIGVPAQQSASNLVSSALECPQTATGGTVAIAPQLYLGDQP